MLRNKLFSILSASTLIVFVLSAVFSVPALADSGTTPPTAPASGGGRTASKGSSNSLSQVPSGTKVVVLDSSGNKVPLGSQEAANIVASGDPIWCPSTVAAPLGSGLNGCTYWESDLYTLISDINAHAAGVVPNANGTIWVAAGTYSTESAATIIDGNNPNFNSWKNFTLTIKGGWNGTYGSSLTPGTSTLKDPLEIVNWNNAVTISNVTVENTGPYGISDSQHGDQIGDGLYVQTSGNISLTNFTAYDDTGYGAYLDNCELGLITSGACAGTGTVMVSNSSFNQDDQGDAFVVGGLDVLSHGAITLTGVTANNNYEADGASLDNCLWSGSACQNLSSAAVTITSSIFSDNTYSSYMGLYADSNGAITVTGTTADGNGGVGAQLNNCNYNGSTACTTNGKAVTLTGTNIFDSNTGSKTDLYSADVSGLYVLSGGTITSGSLDAYDNTGGIGVELNNSKATAFVPVTISGASSFTYNSSDGLDIHTAKNISLTNVSALHNQAYGAELYDGTGASIVGSTFNANNQGGYPSLTVYAGLYVLSAGSVTLTDSTADSNNQTSGAWIDSCSANISTEVCQDAGSVTLTGTNIFDGNGMIGLEVLAGGKITSGSLQANGNSSSYYGAWLENTDAASPQAITLSGTSSFSDDGAALTVESKGAISANNLTVDGNANAGANFYNAGTGVGPAPVTITGTNQFVGNAQFGLQVLSNGAVSLNNITSTNNQDIDGEGLWVNNSMAGQAEPVTLTGSNNFSNNTVDGADIYSRGKVTISNVTADSNQGIAFGGGGDGDGILIQNDYLGSSKGQPVVFLGTNSFSNNKVGGLSVQTYGSISLSNLSANSNHNGDGVNLYVNGDVPGAVTLSGVNTFDGNYSEGLFVKSNGSISASNVTADMNGHLTTDSGVVLSNASGVAHGISLTGTNTFQSNYGTGLYVSSQGVVKAANISEDGGVTYSLTYSHSDGADLTGSTVNLSGTNTFSDNALSGIGLYATGAITASNITANYNGDAGGYVNNVGGTGGIVLTGTNTFLYNAGSEGDDGLDMFSSHAVSVTHLTANDNANDGLYASTGGSLTVTCGSFIGNGTAHSVFDYGWEATSSVTSAIMIGTDAFANTDSFSQWTTHGGATPIFTPRTCTLP